MKPQQPKKNIVWRAIRALLLILFKILALIFAWLLKLIGLILTKTGTLIQDSIHIK